MNMHGSQRIAAPRASVYAALNDAEILRKSIPGCEAIEKTSDTGMNARVLVRVGPVSARFAGKVTLSDLDPPKAYTIKGEGSGGMAGFARGGAHVELAHDGTATLLNYTVDAEVGGKIAQLGGRMIDGAAKKLAAEFFDNFSTIVGAPEGAAAPPPPARQGLFARIFAWLKARFGKFFGVTAAAATFLALTANLCCLAGHRHAVDDPLQMPICRSLGGGI
jgi:carbon monoxide dehydrogenase subunit G